MQKTLSILVIWLSLATVTASAAPWHFVTEDFPPFTYPAKRSSSDGAEGPLVEIVQAVCLRLQQDCTITLYPPGDARCYWPSKVRPTASSPWCDHPSANSCFISAACW